MLISTKNYDDFKKIVNGVLGDTGVKVFFGERAATLKGAVVLATDGVALIVLELAALPENLLYDFKDARQLSDAVTLDWGA